MRKTLRERSRDILGEFMRGMLGERLGMFCA